MFTHYKRQHCCKLLKFHRYQLANHRNDSPQTYEWYKSHLKTRMSCEWKIGLHLSFHGLKQHRNSLHCSAFCCRLHRSNFSSIERVNILSAWDRRQQGSGRHSFIPKSHHHPLKRHLSTSFNEFHALVQQFVDLLTLLRQMMASTQPYFILPHMCSPWWWCRRTFSLARSCATSRRPHSFVCTYFEAL